jgi:hypothetical protein
MSDETVKYLESATEEEIRELIQKLWEVNDDELNELLEFLFLI